MPKKSTEVGDSLESLLNGKSKEVAKNPRVPNASREPPPALTHIGIEKQALHKLFILAEEVSRRFDQALEIYALCIGSEGIITDIIIPRQRVSYASIHIEPEYVIEVGETIKKNQHNIIGWAHSHANFSVFFSGTDRSNQTVVLAETSNYCDRQGQRVKYAFGITVNMHHDLFGMVSTQFETGEIVMNEAHFNIGGELSENWDDKKIRKMIGEEIEAKVSTSNWKNFQKVANQLKNPIDIDDSGLEPQTQNADQSSNEKKDADKPQILL